MITKNQVEKFFESKNIAIVGVSQSKHKFGNAIFKELKQKGLNVIPINPKLNSYDEKKCFPNLKSVTEKIDAVVTVVHPENTLKIAAEANELGIKNFWMQQGSESQGAIEFCKEKNMNVIYNECVLMFTENPKFLHSFHKWINKIFNKLPN